jgi:hypothetical protein
MSKVEETAQKLEDVADDWGGEGDSHGALADNFKPIITAHTAELLEGYKELAEYKHNNEAPEVPFKQCSVPCCIIANKLIKEYTP